MELQTVKQPLSNMQLTLLKMFAQNVADEDLKAIQRMIVRYFAEKATALANIEWDEKGYTSESFKTEHMRTSYNKNLNIQK